MTKRYQVLQKRLQEIETELKDILHLPPETPDLHIFSEDLDRRLGFARSLLSAELDSHPLKPHHLHHIDQRLTELETAFREWDNCGTSSPAKDFDAASTCSCTESCLNDDGGEEEEEEEEDDDDERDEEDEDDNGGRGGTELTVYENPEFIEEDGEKKKNEVDEEMSIEKIPQQEEEEVMKDQIGKGLGEMKSDGIRKGLGERKSDGIRKGSDKRKSDGIRKCSVMFAVGILVVVMAWVYFSCSACYTEEVNMEMFLPPT